MAKVVNGVTHYVNLTVPVLDTKFNMSVRQAQCTNPMNLSTFSDMKSTRPSSARRKKKPSMESRWGKPESQRIPLLLFDPALPLTGTSAVITCLVRFLILCYKSFSNISVILHLPPCDDDVDEDPEVSSSFFGGSSGNTGEGSRDNLLEMLV